MRTRHWIAPLLVTIAGCAATPPPAPPPEPIVNTEPEPEPEPVVQQRPDGQAWKSPNHLYHPDVGRIWSNKAQTSLTWSQFLEEMSSSNTILLGEKHDNEDHHDLQAAVLFSLAEAGRRPVVVIEMVDKSQEKKLTKFTRRGGDPDELRELLSWDSSGWPDWEIYRAVFVAAVVNKLPMLGAHIPHAKAKKIAGRGLKAVKSLDRNLVRKQGLTHPLEPENRAGLEDVLYESHCRVMPRHHLGGMLLIQRVRDAWMTTRIEEVPADSADGAVLIAGSGHVRNDWAVPRYLKRHGRDATSVAFVEVDAEVDSETGRSAPPLTAGELAALPYDYVILTPRPDRGDVCAELRKRL
jgi:uncharacterized iron-regulated protein